MNKMKTSSTDLQVIWDELCDIFSEQGRRNFSQKKIKRLEGLGFQVEKNGGGHIKIKVNYKGRVSNIICSSSSSDKNACRQVLREFRRIYEERER